MYLLALLVVMDSFRCREAVKAIPIYKLDVFPVFAGAIYSLVAL